MLPHPVYDHSYRFYDTEVHVFFLYFLFVSVSNSFVNFNTDFHLTLEMVLPLPSCECAHHFTGDGLHCEDTGAPMYCQRGQDCSDYADCLPTRGGDREWKHFCAEEIAQMNSICDKEIVGQIISLLKNLLKRILFQKP